MKNESIKKKAPNKGLNEFEKAIKVYLDKQAVDDPVFAEKYRKGLEGKKTIEACGRFIISTVRSTGRQGFADSEIYGMALHFYDEESIKAPAGTGGVKVVVNHTIELTEEEKEKARKEAREQALRQIRAEEQRKVRAEAERKARAEAKAASVEAKKAERAKARAEAKAAELEAEPNLFSMV